MQINDKKFNQTLYFIININEDKDKDKSILKMLNSNEGEIIVSLWIEDSYTCFDYIGKLNIELKNIFEKGKISEKKFVRDDSSEVIYMPKVYKVEGLGEQIDVNDNKNEISLTYDIWFYPDTFTKDVYIIKEDQINKNNIKEDNQYIEILKKNKDKYEDIIRTSDINFSEINNRYWHFINNTKDSNYTIFTVRDENNESRIINSYLSYLTIASGDIPKIVKNNTNIINLIDELIKDKESLEKIKLPLINEKSLMHYIRCMRYINQQVSGDMIISPSSFMICRKGTKLEHAISYACILMNFCKQKEKSNDRIKEKLKSQDISDSNNTTNRIDDKTDRSNVNLMTDHKNQNEKIKSKILKQSELDLVIFIK